MSEIYAPGSIAGPQGPVGPAGSAAAVSALAGAILPSFVGRNLYDPALALDASQVNAADGTLTIGGQPTNLSPLMYCPGATSMVTNGIVNSGNWGGGVCLYDANGAFLSALSAGTQINTGVAFALPGTQTYVRWGHVFPWDSIPDAAMMCFATITGTAALPAAYQPAGVETVANVNAKDAAVAAGAASALSATVQQLGAGMGLFAKSVLPAPFGAAHNAFDPAKVLVDTKLSASGAQVAAPGWSTAIVFAPGATQFISNLPIRGVGSGVAFCLYDACGNFLQEISATTLAATMAANGGLLLPNAVFALPGNQTFVGFTYNAGNFGWGPESNGFCFTPNASAGMFLTGSASSPCPASLPSGAPALEASQTRIKTASELGCALDANIVTGTGTDNTALLNAFLATASAANPVKLILDGPCLVRGLVVAAPGYTTIEGTGWGSGIVVAAGANQNGISVGCAAGHYDQTGAGCYDQALPARSAANVALRNLTINGNGAGNAGNFGVLFANCTGILMEHVNFLEAAAFASTFSNCAGIQVRGCNFTSAGVMHDGVHIDGKCEDIAISDCTFATGDDAIALNAPEGYGGDISRVTVTNCRFNGSLTVMRIYTSLDTAAMPTNNVHTVRDVVVSNCTGYVTTMCFNLGITNGGLSATADADQIQDLLVSNCTLSAPGALGMLLTPIGSLRFRGVNFIPISTQPMLQVWAGFSFGEVALEGVRVLRNASGNAAPAALVQLLPGATVDRLSLLDCRVVDEAGSSYAAIPSLLDAAGTVAALRLEAIDMAHITALVSGAGWAGVTALRGGGVMGTGIPVPDSVMDANALYLSSNAGGAPSIKLGGTARRLTLA